MKMECRTNSIFRGDVVRRGALVDMTPEEAASDFAKANFSAVEDEGPAQPPAPSPYSDMRQSAVAGLTREQAIAKLRASGASVRGNISNAALKELYNNTFATVTEATAR